MKAFIFIIITLVWIATLLVSYNLGNKNGRAEYRVCIRDEYFDSYVWNTSGGNMIWKFESCMGS